MSWNVNSVRMLFFCRAFIFLFKCICEFLCSQFVEKLFDLLSGWSRNIIPRWDCFKLQMRTVFAITIMKNNWFSYFIHSYETIMLKCTKALARHRKAKEPRPKESGHKWTDHQSEHQHVWHISRSHLGSLWRCLNGPPIGRIFVSNLPYMLTKLLS